MLVVLGLCACLIFCAVRRMRQRKAQQQVYTDVQQAASAQQTLNKMHPAYHTPTERPNSYASKESATYAAPYPDQVVSIPHDSTHVQPSYDTRYSSGQPRSTRSNLKR